MWNHWIPAIRCPAQRVGLLIALLVGAAEPIDAQAGSAIRFLESNQPRAFARHGVDVAISPSDASSMMILSEGAPDAGLVDRAVLRKWSCSSASGCSELVLSSTQQQFTAVAVSHGYALFAEVNDGEDGSPSGQIRLWIRETPEIGDFGPTGWSRIYAVPHQGTAIDSLATVGSTVVYGQSLSNAGDGRVVFCTILGNQEPPLACPQSFSGQTSDFLGRSVALHPNQNLAVVGAPGRGANGVVEIFVRGTGGLWSKVQTVHPPGFYALQSSANFGRSVAVAGQWLAVGAPYADALAIGPGSQAVPDVGNVLLYDTNLVFEFSSMMIGSGEAALLGHAVAMSPSEGGHLMLVAGAPWESDSASASHGRARVFYLPEGGEAWQPGPTLHDPDDETGLFGFAVATDGRRVLVGTPFFDVQGGSGSVDEAGSVLLFERVGPQLFVDGFESGSASAWGSNARRP